MQLLGLEQGSNSSGMDVLGCAAVPEKLLLQGEAGSSSQALDMGKYVGKKPPASEGINRIKLKAPLLPQHLLDQPHTPGFPLFCLFVFS